jgi:putative glutamine amidotransferase
MSQPVIGITTSQGLNTFGHPTVFLMQSYIDAVLQAGGAPVLIPSMLEARGMDDVYARLDGMLFPGGGDVGLDRFNGDLHPRIEDVNPQRDATEINLVHALAKDGKPFLAICRGCQVVNVALGGTLYTHLPDQFPGALDHDYPGSLRAALVHEVRIEKGTRLAEIVGEPILKVNSNHHQGLKEIAAALRVAGYSPDGLVEAIELPDHPFGLGVQWHPEWLTDQLSTQHLFGKFVEAAGGYNGAR